MRSLTTSTLVSLLISLSSVARAEEEPARYADCLGAPSDPDVEGAKGAFRAGQASFNEGDYARAITYWEDAYRRDCTAHALLLNLSRAYELSGQLKHVVNALQTYNARTTDPVQREQNTRRIDKLLAQIEAEQQSAPLAVAVAPAASSPEPAPVQANHAETPPASDEPAPVSEGRPLYPLFIAGGGALVGIVGAALWFPAQSAYNDYIDTECTQTGDGFQCDRADTDGEGKNVAATADDLRDKTLLTGGLAIAGGLVAGIGVAWYFLQSPGTSDESHAKALPLAWSSLRVAPAMWPGASGLSGISGVTVDGLLP